MPGSDENNTSGAGPAGTNDAGPATAAGTGAASFWGAPAGTDDAAGGFAAFQFGGTADITSAFSAFSFGSDTTDAAAGSGPAPQTGDAVEGPGTADEAGDQAPLRPTEVLGAEDETPVWQARAKVYRFDSDLKEWQDRGIGLVSFLRSAATKRVRLLMVRDQVFKLCLNQYLVPEAELSPHGTTGKLWSWSALDYAYGDGAFDILAIRLKDTEYAKEFKACFDALKVGGSIPDTVLLGRPAATPQDGTAGTAGDTPKDGAAGTAGDTPQDGAAGTAGDTPQDGAVSPGSAA